MLVIFVNFAICVCISLCTSTSPSNGVGNGDGTIKIPSNRELELVQNEMVRIDENLNMILDSKTSNDKKIELKGEVRGSVWKIIERAIRAEHEVKELSHNKSTLEVEKKIASENTLLNLWRIVIDDYESSFPQTYDTDFEQKKVIYDKSKLENLISYDAQEERRRQKWWFYCNNPPNKKMLDLVSFLKKEKVDLDIFSRGVAKAYRSLSDHFHCGYFKVICGDPKKFFQHKNAVTAMRILLKQEDILDEIIEKAVPEP